MVLSKIDTVTLLLNETCVITFFTASSNPVVSLKTFELREALSICTNQQRVQTVNQSQRKAEMS
jgi:hypothetical protein